MSPPARIVVAGLGVELIFPTKNGKALSETAMWRTLKAAAPNATVHGLRSSFRDWAAENGVPREVAEASLAHTVKGVEGAYLRSDLVERRRPVMEAWADYLSA